MNIVDYASLQTAVADWLNRADLSSRILDFIGLAEVRLMRKLRMRLLEAEETLTGTIGSRTIALPSDYREPLNFWWSNGVDRTPLRFAPPELLDVWDSEGRPVAWTIDGTNIAFDRACDSAYSFIFRYRQKLQLSDANPTNVILTNYPDAYLFGALVEAGPFLRDDDLLQLWEGRFEKALDEIREEEGRQKSLSTLSVDPMLVNWYRRTGFSILRGY